jgi:hypothetical protein
MCKTLLHLKNIEPSNGTALSTHHLINPALEGCPNMQNTAAPKNFEHLNGPALSTHHLMIPALEGCPNIQNTASPKEL